MGGVWAAYVTELHIGALLATILVPFTIADQFKRPTSILLGLIISSLGHLLQFLAGNIDHFFWLLFVGRFLTPLGANTSLVFLPVFISEAAPPEIRGRLGISQPLGMALGTLLASVLGLPAVFGNATCWPYAFLVFLLLSLPALPLCFCLKDTPIRLAAKGKHQQAEESLSFYRGQRDTDEQLRANMLEEVETVEQEVKTDCLAFYRLCTLHPLRKPLLISLAIVLAYAVPILINSYSTAIFWSIGMSNELATSLTVALKVVSVVAFFICFALIDRYGRRRLVVFGLLVSAVCWLLMVACQAVISYTSGESSYKRFATICFSAAFFVAQIALNFGIRPVFWILILEMFPFRFRSTGKSFVLTLFTIYNIILSLVFYFVLSAVPLLVHILLATTLWISFAYIYISLPETKGKAPIEIFPQLRQLTYQKPAFGEECPKANEEIGLLSAVDYDHD